MIKNKISVVFNFKEENLEFQKEIVNNGGTYFDHSINLGRHANQRIINLELINNNFVITPDKITFYDSGENYVNRLNTLKKTHNLVSFKYIKDKNYTFDMSRYDQETLNKEAKENVENNIIWRLEVGGSVYDELRTDLRIIDYIEKKDASKIVSYILNNEKVKENCGVNIENFNFKEKRSPNCLKVIEEYKREIELDKEPFYSIDIESL